jgi:hypothetical protein
MQQREIRDLKQKLAEMTYCREEIETKYNHLRDRYDNVVKINDNTIADLRLTIDRDKCSLERVTILEHQVSLV